MVVGHLDRDLGRLGPPDLGRAGNRHDRSGHVGPAGAGGAGRRVDGPRRRVGSSSMRVAASSGRCSCAPCCDSSAHRCRATRRPTRSSLESMLTAAESIITYRRRYRSQAQIETVLDLLRAGPRQPPLDRLPGRSPGHRRDQHALRLRRRPSAVEAADRGGRQPRAPGGHQRPGHDRAQRNTPIARRLPSTGRSGASPRIAGPLDDVHFTHQLPQPCCPDPDSESDRLDRPSQSRPETEVRHDLPGRPPHRVPLRQRRVVQLRRGPPAPPRDHGTAVLLVDPDHRAVPGTGPGAERLLRQPGHLLHHPGAPHRAGRHRRQPDRRAGPSAAARARGRRRLGGRPRPAPERDGRPMCSRLASSSSRRRRSRPLPTVRRDYAGRPSNRGGRSPRSSRDVASRIHADFEFAPGVTTVTTTIDEVLARRAGVCQDFAHWPSPRSAALGLAARYVSGYLETQPPPGQPGSRAPTCHTRGCRCSSARRLDRRRPDERPVRQRSLRDHRLGSRLRRRAAAQGRDLHPGRAQRARRHRRRRARARGRPRADPLAS